MFLKELHPDISRYLKEDCYCPNEIYDTSGFFCLLFPEDSTCELIAKGENVFSCIASTERTLETDPKNLQIINFYIDKSNGTIDDAFRVDATENNIGVVKRLCAGNVRDDDRFDEYKPGSTKASLEKLFSISDLIIRD